MEKGNLSFIISTFSLFVAALALGWNIYRDVILKARIKVDIGVNVLISPGIEGKPKYIVLTITNFGPGDINLSMIQMKYAPLWRRILRKAKYAIIIHDYTNPLSAKLPIKLSAGDRIDLLLPHNGKSFLGEPCTHIGISDYFGRIHWASRKRLAEAKKAFKKDFLNKKT